MSELGINKKYAPLTARLKSPFPPTTGMRVTVLDDDAGSGVVVSLDDWGLLDKDEWLRLASIIYHEYADPRFEHYDLNEWWIIRSRHTDNPGWVYLMECHGLFKIGMSSDPTRRERELNAIPTTVMPFDIRLRHSVQTDDMKCTEAALHLMFHDKRQRGEWFHLDSEDVEWIVSMDSLDYCELSELEIEGPDLSIKSERQTVEEWVQEWFDDEREDYSQEGFDEIVAHINEYLNASPWTKDDQGRYAGAAMSWADDRRLTDDYEEYLREKEARGE